MNAETAETLFEVIVRGRDYSSSCLCRMEKPEAG